MGFFRRLKIYGYKFFIKFFAKELIENVFYALLARKADEAGLGTYSKKLLQGSDLSAVIEDVALSHEHWVRQLKFHTEYLVREGYKGILGREPDAAAFKTYKEMLVCGDAGLSDFLSDLVKSEEHRAMQIKREVFIPEISLLIDKLYEVTLGRSPDEKGKAAYMKVLSGFEKIPEVVQSLIDSPEFDQNKKNKAEIYKKALQVQEVGGCIYLCIERPAMLPYVLAMADHFYNIFHKKSIIVTLFSSDFIFDNYKLSAHVSMVVTLDFLIKISGFLQLNPQLICVHSFIRVNEFRELLNFFPGVPLVLYADGALNSLRSSYKSNQPKGVVYFLYEPITTVSYEKGVKADLVWVVSSHLVYGYNNKISQKLIGFNKNFSSEEKYSVLFLRYWDGGGYKMPISVFLITLLNMLNDHLQKDELLIVKSDPRCSPHVLKKLLDLLASASIKAISFEDYLNEDLGSGCYDYPIEYFFSAGYLLNGRKYFVLDSTLSLTLPLNNLIQLPFEIVSGCKEEYLPSSFRKKYVSMFRPHVEYTHLTQKALYENEWSTLDSEGGHYFHYRIDSVPRPIPTPTYSSYASNGDDILNFLDLAVVHVLSESWLPYCLALAEYLKDTEGLNTVLVVDDPLIFKSYEGDFPDFIYCIASIDRVFKLIRLGRFSAKRCFFHSYASREVIEESSNLISPSSVDFYADAFKNEVDFKYFSMCAPQRIFYFGYDPYQISDFDGKVISFQLVAKWFSWFFERKIKVTTWSEKIAAPKIDIVVCLRYWGEGPYSFSYDNVRDIFVKTISRYAFFGANIVIKNDLRVNSVLYENLISDLKKMSFNVFLLDDILDNCTLDLSTLPFEFFLIKGFFLNASAYIVFDSSLAYIIPRYLKAGDPSKIVIGADLGEHFCVERENFEINHHDQIDQEAGLSGRSVQAGVNTIAYYTERYAKQLKAEGFSVVKQDDFLYELDLSLPI